MQDLIEKSNKANLIESNLDLAISLLEQARLLTLTASHEGSFDCYKINGQLLSLHLLAGLSPYHVDVYIRMSWLSELMMSGCRR